MDITPQIKALKVIYAAIDLENHLDALLKYTAARVITDRLLKLFSESDTEKRQVADYVGGRLLSFAQKVENAVMPSPRAEKTPSQWLELAGDDLRVAETKSQGV